MTACRSDPAPREVDPIEADDASASDGAAQSAEPDAERARPDAEPPAEAADAGGDAGMEMDATPPADAASLDASPSSKDASSDAEPDARGSVDAEADANVDANVGQSFDAGDAGPLADAAADAAAADAGDAAPAPPSCDVMLELRAHGAQTLPDTTPYLAPQNDAHYEAFWFAPSWDTQMQVIGVEPLIDNAAVVASWKLFMYAQSSTAVGSHASDLGLQGVDATLLAQWAPGAQMAIPVDVGLRVVQGANARLALTVHYAAGTNPNREDRSGVRLCLTRTLRSKEAAIHWLGTQLIVNLLASGDPSSRVSFSGLCTPEHTSHIIGFAPHMHRQGRRIRLKLDRTDQDISETLADREFTFAAQSFIWLPQEVVVQPEDVLTTTCTYASNATFTFGPSSEDEQCFAFVLAWPAGSLTNGSNGISGHNTCIDTVQR